MHYMGSRRPRRAPRVFVRLVRVGRDNFASGLGSDRPPHGEADRLLDEVHRAVAEADVDATGVAALAVQAPLKRWPPVPSIQEKVLGAIT